MAEARGAIAHNRAEFTVLESAALSCDDPFEAAALTRMAYEYAIHNHPGMLTSAALERLLGDLGRRMVGAAAVGARTGPIERVLHVATEVYEYGGHGRVLERWIEHDRQRIPTVLLLNGDHPVPDSVVRAVAEREGAFARVSLHTDMFSRARELRALACRHDLVVLHIHNYEVLVALALAQPAGRPPTIFLNHSSHLMWAGIGCSDVVVSFSDAEAQMTVERRGVPAKRSVTLGLPSTPRDLPDRDRARAELGLDPDAPVLLTMSTAYKLHPVFSVAYRDLAAAALKALPRATLLLVGPRAKDGVVYPDRRIRELGLLSDPSVVLAAADILIDSWPLTGGTTVIDAAAAGLTVIALGDPPPPILCAPPGALDGCVLRARDLEELGERLAEFWANPSTRSDLRARAEAAVQAQHANGWSSGMERVLLAAGEHQGASTAPSERSPEPIAQWEAVIQAQRALETQKATLMSIYARNLELLPAERRPQSMAGVSAHIEIARAGAPKPPRVFAAPRLVHEEIVGLLERMRELIADGAVISGVILIAADRLDDAVALIEPAITGEDDIDIELQVGEDPAAFAQPTDVILSERDYLPGAVEASPPRS
jgi:glycosyltransferase involved in cell wall biosynthesis